MPVTRKKIVETYCDQLSETGHRPKTVSAFCKELKLEESKFYAEFASFNAIESYVLEMFYENTLALLKKDPSYAEADAQNKLLAFYYTFFEVLNSNRSLVMQIIPTHDKKWLMSKSVKGLKSHFQSYVDDLEIEISFLKNTPLSSYQDKGVKSVAWLQMVKTIEFWLKDESKGFEKTDLYIEKSLRASFDLIQKNPFESLLDFGKFVYHETVKK